MSKGGNSFKHIFAISIVLLKHGMSQLIRRHSFYFEIMSPEEKLWYRTSRIDTESRKRRKWRYDLGNRAEHYFVLLTTYFVKQPEFRILLLRKLRRRRPGMNFATAGTRPAWNWRKATARSISVSAHRTPYGLLDRSIIFPLCQRPK